MEAATRHTRCCSGRLTSIIDWPGPTTTIAHDKPGRITSTTIAAGTTTLGELVYAPDVASQITTETSTSMGATRTFINDTVGRVTKENAVVYAYDGADQLTTKASTTQGYDAAGQLTTAVTRTTSTAFVFDAPDLAFQLAVVLVGALVTVEPPHHVLEALPRGRETSGPTGCEGRILQGCAGVLEAGQRGSHHVGHVSLSKRQGLGSSNLGVGQCRALMGSAGRAVTTRLATSAAERGQRAAQQRRLSAAVDSRRPRPLLVVVGGTTYRPPVLS